MADAGSRLQRWFAELRRRKALRVAGVYLRAVRHGRGNLGWIEQDTDFASLHGDPRCEAIVGRLRAAASGALQ